MSTTSTRANGSTKGAEGLLHFTPVGPSQMDIPYADLMNIDLSTFADGPDAQQKLAGQLYQAMTTQGFFVLTGFGISEEEIARQVDIGYTVLEKTPLEEKKELDGHMDQTGQYRGFKLRNYYEMEKGVKDQIEQFNWQRDMSDQPMPSTIKPFQAEVKSFCERVHKDVLYKVYQLFALALKLPIDTFVNFHKYEEKDDSWFRYMAYYDEFSPEDEEKVGGVWLKGHQDHGAVTMVFSQPMASLQVRDEQGVWRYTRHTPGGIIINCGIMMEWWTGGLFKAANHRVFAPPQDQRNHTRCGVFYFSIPNNDVRPDLLVDSPVLQRAGVKSIFKDGKNIDALTFSRARVAKVGKSDIYKQPWGAGARLVEVIAGVEVPHFG
ncbi:uncharacterized protein I303_101343 [Kwoniella dejecticola CBS 10117]|uniref:Fe2OG dioxygenase domain-containing protein n=1 Tax=Kwoniella dejecticola CBS 10117 TaxID=1296121 RepID=A0A1A6AHI5_9TREE|nr:uncharacterized protein I303_01352 [Kwoniella dejecticola CBS 10117]OBR89524.1 hypothetical protein I303_01352 [Kwoniella dejecticola CBS 10117]